MIFKTAEEARAHVLGTKLTGDRFELAISDDFTFAGRPDAIGAGMSLVLDAILAQDYTVDGFDQRGGYRVYRYKPLTWGRGVSRASALLGMPLVSWGPLKRRHGQTSLPMPP